MSGTKKGGDSNKFLQRKLNNNKYVNADRRHTQTEKVNAPFFSKPVKQSKVRTDQDRQNDLNLQVHAIIPKIY